MSNIPYLIGQTFSDAFGSLQYVTNPYALFGFVLLVAMVGIGQASSISPLARTNLLGLSAVGALFIAGYVLVTSLDRAENVVRENLMIHLVKGAGRVALSNSVEIKLVDIETLKKKVKKHEKPSGHESNKSRGDTEHVFGTILAEAGVTDRTVPAVVALSQEEWESFLDGLPPHSKDVILDYPFVRLAVYVDGQRSPQFDSAWFFKNEVVSIPTHGSSVINLRLVNVYNTKHDTSGEREAINVRLELSPEVGAQQSSRNAA